MLEPEKRSARFLFQGRGTRERSHAQNAQASEHGEHPPLETGFFLVLGLDQSKGGASDKHVCLWCVLKPFFGGARGFAPTGRRGA